MEFNVAGLHVVHTSAHTRTHTALKPFVRCYVCDCGSDAIHSRPAKCHRFCVLWRERATCIGPFGSFLGSHSATYVRLGDLLRAQI